MKTEESTNKDVSEKFKVGDRVYINDSLWDEANGWCKIVSISTAATEAILERERCDGHTLSIPLHILDKIASFTEYKLETVGFSQERPKPKKKNGDPFEVGDNIWVLCIGGVLKGVIIDIDLADKGFPIVCTTEDGRTMFTTKDGKDPIVHQTALFHQEPVITFNEDE